MQLKNEVRNSLQFKTFTLHHPGYFQLNKYQPRIITVPNEVEVKEDLEEDSKPNATLPTKETINKTGTEATHDEEEVSNYQYVDASSKRQLLHI
jgi:hypothetical protein